ncbi:uncharacterized protein LOC143212005 [Lasioglossum baleicum]|uniref:uncharacterized protein LOC143212005 n=1 Tax=Lasioglossum baleicum TaxID=434251 RepID=UPI003FCCCD88
MRVVAPLHRCVVSDRRPCCKSRFTIEIGRIQRVHARPMSGNVVLYVLILNNILYGSRECSIEAPLKRRVQNSQEYGVSKNSVQPSHKLNTDASVSITFCKVNRVCGSAAFCNIVAHVNAFDRLPIFRRRIKGTLRNDVTGKRTCPDAVACVEKRETLQRWKSLLRGEL